MKSDYWNVTDEQVLAKTGKVLAEWHRILGRVAKPTTKPAELVLLLQQQHAVPRYWARTLTTNFLRSVAGSSGIEAPAADAPRTKRRPR